MAELSDREDQDFEMAFAGRKYKVRFVGLLSVQAEFEAEIRSQYNTEIIKAADTFGLTGQERYDFLSSKFDDAPYGDKLTELVTAKMNGIEGICKILAHAIRRGGADIDENIISEMVMADPDAARAWAEFLTHVQKKMPTRKKK